MIKIEKKTVGERIGTEFLIAICSVAAEREVPSVFSVDKGRVKISYLNT